VFLGCRRGKFDLIKRRGAKEAMPVTPRYTIKKYLMLIVISATVGVFLCVAMLLILGFGSQGTLVVLIFSFPLWLFGTIYGFYKGLVRYYGLQGNENMFFGGKF
jgi:hypothetical protein